MGSDLHVDVASTLCFNLYEEDFVSFIQCGNDEVPQAQTFLNRKILFSCENPIRLEI